MADTKFHAVVTDLGAIKMMKAVSEGTRVKIRYFAVGDGNGSYYVPDTEMAQLKNEVWRGDVGMCKISDESENVLIVEAVIPSNEGGFTIREMAVFDEERTMIAVCNTPDTAKVRVTDGVVHELQLQMEIILNNKDSVELSIDPNVVVATKKDIQSLKAELLLRMQVTYDQQNESLIFASGRAPEGCMDEIAQLAAKMAVNEVEAGINSATADDIKRLF